MKTKIGAALLSAVLTGGTALASSRPVVVELYTSQACSDCPPADALLRQVKSRDPGVLTLDLHVTYWNSFAWRDPYATEAATARQSWYAALRHSGEVYTPQAVVDGRIQFVGSNAGAMRAAITKARLEGAASVPVSLSPDGARVAVHVGAGQGEGTIWLFGFDPEHTTHVRGGENGGATLTEVNVVRSITRLGAWQGRPVSVGTPRPEGTRFAVLVQKDDGAILGAGAD